LAGHRCRYGIDAFLAKFLYGWAHLFAIWDLLRRRPMGWKPTGVKVAGRRNQRMWAAIWIWSGGTSAAWIGTAVWRTITGGPRFLPLLGLGLLAGWITTLALRSRD
jgi:cellulose synthase (UDP-forming)